MALWSHLTELETITTDTTLPTDKSSQEHYLELSCHKSKQRTVNPKLNPVEPLNDQQLRLKQYDDLLIPYYSLHISHCFVNLLS